VIEIHQKTVEIGAHTFYIENSVEPSVGEVEFY